jgi:hypothetical protein
MSKNSDEKIVVIAEFQNYQQAEIARQILEDNGIKGFATGENSSNLYGGISAIERPQLQVKQSDGEKARQILEDNKEQLK